MFKRQVYFDVLADSVSYFREEKGMELYCYCFMPNDVHFIFRSANEKPSELLRDFKRYTSKKVIEAIKNNSQESRKEWLLWMFKREEKRILQLTKHQFWQHQNKRIELWSAKVITQKIDYIHNNPVISGFVVNPED